MADQFRVYKKADGAKIAEGVSPVKLTGLASGTTVAEGDYQATRVRGEKESKKVDLKGFTTLKLPTKPTVKVTPKDKGMDFVITPSPTATEEGVTGYKIYTKKASEPWSAAKSTTVTELTGGFGTMENGVKYTFGVEALNANGASPRLDTTFTAGAPAA